MKIFVDAEINRNMKKSPLIGRIFLGVIFVSLLLELTFIVVCKGNVGINFLAFNQFEKKELYKSEMVLKDNQYIDEGYVYTIFLIPLT